MSKDMLERFTYFPPNEDRAQRHTQVRSACRGAAVAVEMYCPEGREKSLAMTKLEEAMFWANAAIAREAA